MDHADDCDHHKKELCVKEDAEIIDDADAVINDAECMPYHKHENREECGCRENVMR